MVRERHGVCCTAHSSCGRSPMFVLLADMFQHSTPTCAPTLSSAAGVSAVLHSCRHLTSLQLQQCVGPLHVSDMLSPQQQRHTDRATATARQRWQLSTLQLSGPRTACTDTELMQLLGLQPSGHVISSTSSNSTQLPTPAAPVITSSISTAYLIDLCLVRVEGLTDACLLHLAAAGCRLRHLRLEDCFTDRLLSQAVANATTASTVTAASLAASAAFSGSPNSQLQQQQQEQQPDGNGCRTPSFSPSALLQLVGDSCALSLRSLTLRHAGIWMGCLVYGWGLGFPESTSVCMCGAVECVCSWPWVTAACLSTGVHGTHVLS